MELLAPAGPTIADADRIPVARAVGAAESGAGGAGDGRPVVVVDGGTGGAGVAAAIRRRLPEERVVYLARADAAPGGRAAAVRMAVARFGPKHVVLADGPAGADDLSAVASGGRADDFPRAADLFSPADAPPADAGGGSAPLVSSAIDPAARAAVRAAGASRRPTVAVLAAEPEARTRAYEHAVLRRRQLAALLVQPAPLLAAMAEDGRRADDPLLRLAVRQYLAPVLDRRPSVVLLGGSADPELVAAVRAGVAEALDDLAARPARRSADGRRVGRRRGRVAVIDAAAACADDVARRLADAGRLAPHPADPTTADPTPVDGAGVAPAPMLRCLVVAEPGTPPVARFADAAARVFGPEGDPVEAIDPSEFARPAEGRRRFRASA